MHYSRKPSIAGSRDEPPASENHLLYSALRELPNVMSSTESVERSVRTLLRRGTRLNNVERFDAARPFFALAYARAMQSLGEDADLTLEALNCLALCDFNRMDYAVALQHYSALLERLRRVLPDEDELISVTEASVLRCQSLASAGPPCSVAEIVFRSFFSNEEEHAQFVLEHGVRIERGDRLDPHGSALFVLSPVPELPAFIEHMPGGVEVPEETSAWTLQIRWDYKDGSRLLEQRFLDGTVRRTWR